MEEIVSSDCKSIKCPKCSKSMLRYWKKSPVTFTVIVPDYPGSKKHKAGYVHSHGDRSATKVQSGYGGCVNPKN
jgi:hypothetical protein